MAYLNINNMCIFEGRLGNKPELTYIQNKGNNTSYAKCKFSVAIEKNMTKEQKAKAQANKEKTADFVQFEVIGPKAEFVANYFEKGNGIKVVSSFRPYSYQSKEGQTVYSYAFDVIDVSFTVGSVTTGAAGKAQTKTANVTHGIPADNSVIDPFGSLGEIDESDIPFV